MEILDAHLVPYSGFEGENFIPVQNNVSTACRRTNLTIFFRGWDMHYELARLKPNGACVGIKNKY